MQITFKPIFPELRLEISEALDNTIIVRHVSNAVTHPDELFTVFIRPTALGPKQALWQRSEEDLKLIQAHLEASTQLWNYRSETRTRLVKKAIKAIAKVIRAGTLKKA